MQTQNVSRFQLSSRRRSNVKTLAPVPLSISGPGHTLQPLPPATRASGAGKSHGQLPRERGGDRRPAPEDRAVPPHPRLGPLVFPTGHLPGQAIPRPQ